MVRFTAEIKKYGSMGEKTGWTYVDIPVDLAEKLYPGNRTSFRVKGKLDALAINAQALIPVGEGHFILPLNVAIRRQLGKRAGHTLELQIQRDDNPDPFPLPDDLAACFGDEPAARQHFFKLPKSHQHYYIKWINSAKTEPTRVKRIAQAISALTREMHYGEMIRSLKKE